LLYTTCLNNQAGMDRSYLAMLAGAKNTAACSHHQASVSTADSTGIAMVDVMWLGPMH